MWRYRDCLANGCRLFSKSSAPDVVCVWRLAAPDRSRWWRGLLSLPFPTLAEARSTVSQPVRKMRSKWPGSRFREIERLAAGVTQMHRLHRWYCRSSRWKRTLDNNILPWALSRIQLVRGSPGSRAGSGIDHRLATASGEATYLHRNGFRVGELPTVPDGKQQCDRRMWRCSRDALRGRSILQRRLLHDASSCAFTSLTGPVVCRSVPSPQTRRYFRWNR